MENSTKIKINNANEAKDLALKAQERNYENLLEQIGIAANSGQTSFLLFMPIPFVKVKELMALGFSISEIFHPMEQRNIQKVSW